MELCKKNNKTYIASRTSAVRGMDLETWVIPAQTFHHINVLSAVQELRLDIPLDVVRLDAIGRGELDV